MIFVPVPSLSVLGVCVLVRGQPQLGHGGGHVHGGGLHGAPCGASMWGWLLCGAMGLFYVSLISALVPGELD